MSLSLTSQGFNYVPEKQKALVLPSQKVKVSRSLLPIPPTKITAKKSIPQRLLKLIYETDPTLGQFMNQHPILFNLLDASVSKGLKTKILTEFLESTFTDRDTANKLASIVNDINWGPLMRIQGQMSPEAKETEDTINTTLGTDVYSRMNHTGLFMGNVNEVINKTFTAEDIEQMRRVGLSAQRVAELIHNVYPGEDPQEIFEAVNRVYDSATPQTVQEEGIGGPPTMPQEAKPEESEQSTQPTTPTTVERRESLTDNEIIPSGDDAGPASTDEALESTKKKIENPEKHSEPVESVVGQAPESYVPRPPTLVPQPQSVVTEGDITEPQVQSLLEGKGTLNLGDVQAGPAESTKEDVGPSVSQSGGDQPINPVERKPDEPFELTDEELEDLAKGIKLTNAKEFKKASEDINKTFKSFSRANLERAIDKYTSLPEGTPQQNAFKFAILFGIHDVVESKFWTRELNNSFAYNKLLKELSVLWESLKNNDTFMDLASELDLGEYTRGSGLVGHYIPRKAVKRKNPDFSKLADWLTKLQTKTGRSILRELFKYDKFGKKPANSILSRQLELKKLPQHIEMEVRRNGDDFKHFADDVNVIRQFMRENP